MLVYVFVTVLLSWISDADTAAVAFNNAERIGPESLRDPLSHGLRDEAVDVSAIYHFLTLPARRALQCKLSRLRKQPWVCAICAQSLDEVRCIACDLCLQWFHYHCQSLLTTPSHSTYYCTMCIRA